MSHLMFMDKQHLTGRRLSIEAGVNDNRQESGRAGRGSECPE